MMIVTLILQDNRHIQTNIDIIILLQTGKITYDEISSDNGKFFVKLDADFEIDDCDEAAQAAATKDNHKMITQNIFKEIKPEMLQTDDEPSCNCLGTENCGRYCENRAMLIECSLECVDDCTNQRIRKGLSINIERFLTIEKGYGVRALQDIEEGEMIIEYIGEVISEDQYVQRMLREYQDDMNSYAMHLHEKFIVDAHRHGNLSKFINHSCDPNCHVEIWIVDGLPRLIIVASQNIYCSEELSYDYNLRLYNPCGAQKCSCGSKICRKEISQVSLYYIIKLPL